MNELVVFPCFNNAQYYIPILLELKKKDKDIPITIVGNVLQQDIYGIYYYQLRKSGVKFISESEYRISDNQVWYYDYTSELFYNILQELDVKKIVYLHSLRALSTIKKGYQIFNSERHLKNCLANLAESTIHDYNNPIKTTFGAEYFVGGFYHFFDIFPYIAMDKIQLREQLQKKINKRFNPKLPMVSYLVSDYLRDEKFIKTIKKLSKYCTVFIKQLEAFSIKELALENVIQCNFLRESLFRFASDINIVPYTSGSIMTNFALGLPTIPVYSEKIAHRIPKVVDKESLFSSDMMKSFSEYIYIYRNAQPIEYYNLVPPISLEDSDAILELIFNKTYWSNFSRKVEIAKEKYFGNVILEDSVTRTANYVLDILMND